jgi:hypothetical protein
MLQNSQKVTLADKDSHRTKRIRSKPVSTTYPISAFIQKPYKTHRLCPTNHCRVSAYKQTPLLLLYWLQLHALPICYLQICTQKWYRARGSVFFKYILFFVEKAGTQFRGVFIVSCNRSSLLF